MDFADPRLPRAQRIAWTLTALSLLVVLLSAYIRLGGAGLGCAAWPECYGQLLAGAPHPHTGWVRIVHRVAASAALLLGFALAWQCTRPAPLRPLSGHVAALLGVMIVLTVVGLFSADPHRVWAGFINMLGGLLLVLISWRIAALASGEAAPGGRADGALHLGLVLLAAAMALGAMIGARYAALACPTTPSCAGTWWPAAAGLAALNPLATVAAPLPAGDAGGVALHLLHRYAALAALLLVGFAALRALAKPAARAAALAALALTVVEFALGSLTVASGFSHGLAVAHSVGAALLLVAGVHLAGRMKAA